VVGATQLLEKAKKAFEHTRDIATELLQYASGRYDYVDFLAACFLITVSFMALFPPEIREELLKLSSHIAKIESKKSKGELEKLVLSVVEELKKGW